MDPESRRKILEAAYSVLREKPVGEFRLREVSKRAGLSHQTVYNVVGNTGQVLASVLDNYVTRIAETITPMLDEVRQDDPVGAIVSLTQAMTNIALQDPLPIKAVLREIGPLNLSENKTTGTAELCATLLEAGGIPSQSAQEAGRMINYCWRGILVSWAHGLINDEDLQRETKTASKSIAEAVITRHAPLN